MKRLFLFHVLFLMLSVNIVADIPTGLVRIKNRRTATAYLTANTAGQALATSKVNSGLSQIWIIDTKSGGYIVRSANTGEYLNATWETPTTASTTVYIQVSPNATGYYNISSNSDFSGQSCLNKTNSGTGITKWSYSGDAGSDWAIEVATDVTEEEVLQNLTEKTGFVKELQEGKYYRLISYYGLALADTEEVGGDMHTEDINAKNIAQYWTLTKDGSNWKIQNLLTERFVIPQSTTSAAFHTTPAERVTEFNLNVAFKITLLAGKWDFKWTIAAPGNSKGFHDASSQGHNMVLWSTDADASVWSFQEVEVSQEDIDAARQKLHEYDEIVAAFEEIVKNKSNLQTALNELFEDKACTTLKADIAALTDEQLAANENFTALTDDMKAMVLKIKNNTWQQFTNGDYTADYERFFRIADYKIYSHYQTMSNGSNFTMSNSFGKLSGPTGIVANKGDVIYIYVDASPKSSCTLQVEAVSTSGVPGNNQTGSTTDLKAGLNLLQYTEQKMLYIFHQLNDVTKKLANYPDIKIHIEGGRLNGYWDATRGMTNADWKNLQKNLLKESPVLNLKTEHLVFAMDAALVKKCEPNEMEGLMRIWDKIPENEERYMGVEDFEGRYRNIWNVFSIDYNYMFASTYGTYYNNSTLSTIMNYANMRKGGNLWGPSHEMGHNHQATINVIGATESSNNMFSNINIFEQGITASRRDGPTENFNQLAQKTPWTTRDIWLTTSMYFQLYLYFHVQHHDDQFLPNLFRKLRKNPIDKSGSGSKDYLHLAKMICDVAQADLSEFFEAYGMFIPVSNVEVGDYATYHVTTTQTQINSAKKYMQKYEKKLGNIMFIDDRVITHPAIADNIFEAIPQGNNRVPISDEAKNQFLMKSASSTYVGGDYTLYTADAAPSSGDYYTLNSTKKKITFNGTNYAGHKFYDADGNLIWATNAKKSVTLPDVVLNLGIDNVRIMTANYDMTDTPCTDTKPEDAINNIKMGDDVSNREVFDLSGRRVNQVNSGMYIINGKKVIIK